MDAQQLKDKIRDIIYDCDLSDAQKISDIEELLDTDDEASMH